MLCRSVVLCLSGLGCGAMQFVLAMVDQTFRRCLGPTTIFPLHRQPVKGGTHCRTHGHRFAWLLRSRGLVGEAWIYRLARLGPVVLSFLEPLSPAFVRGSLYPGGAAQQYILN